MVFPISLSFSIEVVNYLRQQFGIIKYVFVKKPALLFRIVAKRRIVHWNWFYTPFQLTIFWQCFYDALECFVVKNTMFLFQLYYQSYLTLSKFGTFFPLHIHLTPSLTHNAEVLKPVENQFDYWLTSVFPIPYFRCTF